MNTVTPSTMATRWTDPAARPLFKGSLINENGCCCAQGDVLRCAGWSDKKLRTITQENADKEVAAILGISRVHSVLLRIVNDSVDGCPQDVLMSPGTILGSEWRRVLKFWKFIDGLDADGWKKVDSAGAAAWDAAWAAAWDAARDAAWAAAGAATRDAAGAAARDAAWAAAGDAAWAAAGAAAGAANEIQGAPQLTVFFFLPLFGFANAAAIDALPEATP